MRRYSRRPLIAGLALAALLLAGWRLWPTLMHIAAQAILKSRSLYASKPAPDFALRDANGKVVKLSDYRGKVVLLNFWATWCGPCKVEIPWFIEFQKTYEAQGFTVLGVSMDEGGWHVVKPFAAAEKINYPVLLGDEEVNKAYGGIEALPTTFILRRDGAIGYLHSGLMSRREYENEIIQLLRAAARPSG